MNICTNEFEEYAAIDKGSINQEVITLENKLLLLNS